MPHPLPRCISFDVDGVLLDSLPQHLQLVSKIGFQPSRSDGFEQNSAEGRLREWLARDPRISEYQHHLDALTRLTPVEYRFPNYENVIRQIVVGPS